MIDHLSPLEESELRAAARDGAAWPRLLLAFTEGSRLLLGWDHAIGESGLAARLAVGAAAGGMDALRADLRAAARWCAAHGLHLMEFSGDGPGDDPVGEPRWFMAVG